jgi:hypothetical protein
MAQLTGGNAMRIWPVVAVALMGSACFTFSQPSLQPLVTKDDALDMPQIVGSWAQEGDDPQVIRFRALGDKSYELSCVGGAGEKAKRGTLAVAFGRIGDQLYWDLTAIPLDDEDDSWSLHRLPIHTFARIHLEGDRLEIAYLDSDWVSSALADSSIDIAHTMLDNDVLLTATSAELKQFVLDHGDDEGAFGKADVYARKSAH